jgi:asparagine synthase (glutamine-hydrolysing)
MVAALDHRGPDDSGVVEYDGAVLGSSRLSIIDVKGGRQPLLDADRATALVCNGEIYGHRRLRSLLSDYPFVTGSDCEVILALYRRHGAALLDHLPGTFAFALWDERQRTLLLARDRFGERPLYWAMTSTGCLAFASETHALVSSGLVDNRPDPEMVAQMLRQGYVPTDRSIWQGVRSIPHASRLTWDLRSAPAVQRWWTPPEPDDPRDADEAVEWFRSALDHAVVDQLDADVPIGAFLSGGIDSATIALLAARHHRGLRAFAFDMPGSSEIPYATAVADRHGIDLHVYRPELHGVADRIRSLGRSWDEPFGDSSALPTSMLCEFAREHVKVVLTGDGADELLGGYVVWNRDLLETPTDDRSPMSTASKRFARLRMRAARPPAVDRSRIARRYATFRQYFDADQLGSLGLPPLDAARVDVSAYHYGTADDISRFDLDHYLPGDILVKTDRASMARGLEVRAPFLDVDVATGCLALPSHHKVDATHEKVLLRRAFGDQWPAAVRDRPKQGFGAPMSDWLELPEVARLKADHLVDPASALFELVDHDAVQPFVGANDQRTWNLLMLAVWWEQHRRRAPSEAHA